MTNTKYGRKAAIVLSLDEMISACALDDEPVSEDLASEPTSPESEGFSPSHGIDLEELGLLENATLGEIRGAVRARTLERLGLSEDASDEELMEAAKAEREVDLARAIESADYYAWKELMMQDPDSAHLTEKITPENFAGYKEMQENLWMADELAAELGLSPADGYPEEETDESEEDCYLAEI